MIKKVAKPATLFILICLAWLCRAQVPSETGITVVVIEYGHPGPTRVGEPPSYYRGPLLVKQASDGKVVARGNADSEGRYTFIVPPGKYFITDADQLKPPRNIQSDKIVVVKGQLTPVKLSHDNGML